MRIGRRSFSGLIVVAIMAAALAGFSGCRIGYEERRDPCDDVTCSGHGVCGTSMEGEELCLCDEGYVSYGFECLWWDRDPLCAWESCSGHGKCVYRDSQLICLCDHGYHNPPEEVIGCLPDALPCEGEVDGTPCETEPGAFCSVSGVCEEQQCRPDSIPCDDDDPCTTDFCDDVYDACSNIPLPEGGACDDGLFCTVGEVCTDGVCGNSEPRNCLDEDPCTTDTCDEEADTCVNDPDPGCP